ncbi:hypothetical protein FHX42_005191 [Saccharopolyspora lacisalsi]|uniref:Uncharacterized protein n=1 Tax=Halosaccharopolyspora lacisalsi TaxID=1000566 RepID=A0A839E1S3_9PSEU|nr:hypothetical protein [Halosaccharopolyspora lacisalsi]MBA8827784.1 hypothetical protein [Halosaccharopolyspora lacisalsi]
MGWWLTLIPHPSWGMRPTPVYRGQDLVPTPAVVAAWTMLVLTHPETTESADGARLRHPGDHSPELDAQLATYDVA